ncbi:MAG: hypothetical protein ABR582_05105 [Gemmatimonadaceae bacterium]
MNFRRVMLFPIILAASCAPARNVIPGDYNPSIISEYELNQSGTYTASEAIRRLRPQWLNYQAPTSVSNPNPGVPVVYIDESFGGDLTTLNQLLITQIESISFYKAPQAMIKYGTNRTGGVIAVTIKKQIP